MNISEVAKEIVSKYIVATEKRSKEIELDITQAIKTLESEKDAEITKIANNHVCDRAFYTAVWDKEVKTLESENKALRLTIEELKKGKDLDNNPTAG